MSEQEQVAVKVGQVWKRHGRELQVARVNGDGGVLVYPKDGGPKMHMTATHLVETGMLISGN